MSFACLPASSAQNATAIRITMSWFTTSATKNQSALVILTSTIVEWTFMLDIPTSKYKQFYKNSSFNLILLEILIPAGFECVCVRGCVCERVCV